MANPVTAASTPAAHPHFVRFACFIACSCSKVVRNSKAVRGRSASSPRAALEFGIEAHEEYAAQRVVGVVNIFVAAAVDVIDDGMIQKRRGLVEGIIDTGAQRVVFPDSPRRR